MRLGAKVINFVRPSLFQHLVDRGSVTQIAVLKVQPDVGFVRILIDVIDTGRVEGRRSADHSPHFVSLRQQKLREIGAILPRDTRNQRRLRHAFSALRPRSTLFQSIEWFLLIPHRDLP